MMDMHGTPPRQRAMDKRYDAKMVGALIVGIMLIAFGILAYLAWTLL